LLLHVKTRLPRERFAVTVGCLTREGLIAREMRQAGVRVKLIPGAPGWREPGALAALVADIRSEQPDVVHTYLHAASLYGRLAACLAGVPAVFHSEQNIYARKSRRHLLMERILARRTTKVIACCKAVAQAYARHVKIVLSRLEVIYNA